MVESQTRVRGTTPKLAQYRRLATGHAAWSLLRANTSALILAFVGEAFKSEAEVPMAEARAILDGLLVEWREIGAVREGETDAPGYLRQWISEGYLREADYRLTMTDAAQMGLRFIDGLDRRDLGATASHLRIVQEAVQELILRLSGDIDVRKKILLERKRQIDAELDALSRGVVDRPGADQERELIREVLFLARQLTGDFRYVEDEIRTIDADLRRTMIDNATERGEVLTSFLDQSDLLSGSPAGLAFQGFFQLLCDENRSTEFRQQLRQLASGTIATGMLPEERGFVGNLMRLLTQESQQVIRRRQRTEESLRAFIESDAHRDNRAIEEVLNALFRIGITLPQLPDFNPNEEMPLVLNSGSAHLEMPEALKLTEPDDSEFDDVQIHLSSSELPDDMFERLQTVPTLQIARTLLECLRERGTLTLGQLNTLVPIEHGIEDLVVRVRIAHAVEALDLGAQETIEFTDKDGKRIRARVPSLVLDPERFPAHLEDLAL